MGLPVGTLFERKSKSGASEAVGNARNDSAGRGESGPLATMNWDPGSLKRVLASFSWRPLDQSCQPLPVSGRVPAAARRMGRAATPR